MTEPQITKHIEAARREVRVHAWRPQRVEAALRELQDRYQKRQVRHQWARRGGTMALALAVVVVFAVSASRMFQSESSPIADVPVRAGSELIALGEGTEAHLTEGAQVDVVEQSEERVIVGLHTGTARFRVRHDPNRLFRVEASGVIVEDLGTEFEVENQGESVRVSVTDGVVSVSFTEGGNAKTVTLKAGESGSYRTVKAPTEHAEAIHSAPEGEATPEATTEAPASAASQRAATVNGEPQTGPDWRELARAGKYELAYDIIGPRGFRDVRDEPSDLLLASDVARHSRHPSEAVTFLRKLLAKHDRDPRAPSAAFTLGWVLMSELGRPREAAHAFARAEALGPGGNLAEDAFARSIEAWYRAGEPTRAKADFERYRERYPTGRHISRLERLIGTR